MQQYLNLLQEVSEKGAVKSDRTGTGTVSLFGKQMRFDLNLGFPLVTTKKIYLRAIILELLWFLKGSTNNNWLKEQNVHIWDAWADAKGDLGPVYGAQWRSWPAITMVHPGNFETEHSDHSVTHVGAKVNVQTIDQISNVVTTLKTNPDSRRIMVSAWNPAQVDAMALPPCHCLFQFYTRPLSVAERAAIFTIRHVPDFAKQSMLGIKVENEEGCHAAMDRHNVPRRALSCQLYQRSADLFLGVPFNIASYALLTMMIAQQCGMDVDEFIWTGGDCHVYLNHLEQVQLQLSRDPMRLPTMTINKAESIFDYKLEDFSLSGYEHHPSIKGEVSI